MCPSVAAPKTILGRGYPWDLRQTWKWPVWTGTSSDVTVACSLTALPEMSLRSDDGPADINFSFKEALARLTEQERLMCVWLQLGFSHRAIATCCGLSVVEIEMVHRDALEKIRRLTEHR
jgi:DNA-directed RNA polymerase specialized sigma24 family protein